MPYFDDDKETKLQTGLFLSSMEDFRTRQEAYSVYKGIITELKMLGFKPTGRSYSYGWADGGTELRRDSELVGVRVVKLDMPTGYGVGFTTSAARRKYYDYLIKRSNYKTLVPLIIGQFHTANPNLPLAMSMRERYQDDLKAGHKDAAEYWRGQAAAYFTGNPKLDPWGVPYGYHEYSRHYSEKEARDVAKALRKKRKTVIVLPEGYKMTMWTVFVKGRNNPLPAIVGSVLGGFGAGLGFTAASALVRNVQKNPSYIDIIPQKEKNKINRQLYVATKGYQEKIPINKIADILKSYGYMLVQEDNTLWSGMFVGSSGNAFINISRSKNGVLHPIHNAGLVMTWYKMQSGRYEIVAYIA